MHQATDIYKYMQTNKQSMDEKDGGAKSKAKSKPSPRQAKGISVTNKPTKSKLSKQHTHIVDAFSAIQFRKNIVKRKIALKSVQQLIEQLRLSHINYESYEIAQDLGREWFSQTCAKYPHNSLYMILVTTGFKSRTAHELNTVLTPLKNTSYTTDQLFDFAIEYLNGQYDPIGSPGQPYLFQHPNENEWFQVPQANPNIIFINLKQCQQNLDSISQLIASRESRANQNTRLFYHATNWGASKSILNRIRHEVGRKCLDFGILNSFYCTPHLSDAIEWCEKHEQGWHQETCIFAFRLPKKLPFNVKVFKEPNQEWKDLVKNSRLCKHRSNALDDYDFVYGPMCANVHQIKKRNADPSPHPNIKYQLCSKSDRADQFMHQAMVCVMYNGKI